MNQKQKVLFYIVTHGAISSLESSVVIQVTRLSVIIDELEKDGFWFKSEWEGKGSSRYKKWSLDTEKTQPNIVKYLEEGNDAERNTTTSSTRTIKQSI